MVSERNLSPASFVPFQRGEIEQSIPERFRAVAARAPQSIAICTNSGSISYAHLDRWSDAIASSLLERLGVYPEPVAFLLAQGPLAVATTLGILKSGKHYVPLDPSWGLERARDLVGELGARLVATDAEFASPLRDRLGDALMLELPRECPAAPVPSIRTDIAPDQPAYVYFTSGSTGRPKGVIDCHRNVLHNVMRYTNALRIGNSDRLSLLQSCGFSGAVSSMFSALLNGAVTCPIDARVKTPVGLARWLDELVVTIYHSVPSIFRSLMSPGRVFRHVRVVRLEGDRATRLDLELFRAHFLPPCVVAIGLGTTETGLVCQQVFDHGSAFPAGVVPIGRPVDDVQIEVRGDNGAPAPAGFAGEIVVKSRYLALGYLNDAPATARAFEDAGPGSHERCYKTGDLGRFDSKGCLEYLGRLDGRARIRGQWIELADVEVALCALPGIREAAVRVVGDEREESRLVAYYVTADRDRPTVSLLRRELGHCLPPHMIPSAFIELEHLPLNANGKVDRPALPPPGSARPHLESVFVAPGNRVQLRLCELWEDMLGVRPVGIRDDFFELGGDSLLAVSMMDRVEEICGRRAPVSVLLREPTIEHLAAAAMNGAPESAESVVPIRSAGKRTPFFFLHGDYLAGGFFCRELVRYLDPDQPFSALPPLGADGEAIPSTYEAMAGRHLDAIRAIQPHGPYLLGGECNGGLVAYEIARRLEANGEQVALLALFSASAQNVRFARLASLVQVVGRALGLSPTQRRYIFGRLCAFAVNQHALSATTLLRGLARKLHVIPAEFGRLASMRDTPHFPNLAPGSRHAEAYRARTREIYRQIDRSYLPGRYGGRVTLIFGREESPKAGTERDWWKRVAGEVEAIEVPGDRNSKLTRYVAELARALNRLLDRTQQQVPMSDGRSDSRSVSALKNP